MLKLEDLKNDSLRKEFFYEYDKNWELIHEDNFTGFKYYRYVFTNGDFLTALEYRSDSSKSWQYKAIITLTYAGNYYRPITTTQTEIVNYLKN